jgi:hypothetical protein
MGMNNRIVFSKNGSLNDFSVALSTYRGQIKTFTQVSGQDYLYIGSRLPFNHIYFKLQKPSINTAAMKVQYYDGTSWVDTVEVIDETEGFKKSGMVQFTPNRDKGWGMRSTNYNGEKVPGLEGIVIYDFYWTRISFDASLSEVEIKWAGNLFSNDDDLVSEFPDLLSTANIASWEDGKTNWEEQHVAASKLLTDDLVNKGIICGPEQILDWREFTTACIQKTAEIIFKGMGDDYKDDVLDARKEYNARLARRFSRLDLNNDATETAGERFHSVGFFTR